MTKKIKKIFKNITNRQTILVFFLSFIFSLSAIIYYFIHNQILLYGDAESHLNIAKRIIDSLTPGFAQLGGIWLPLPHLFMIPFVSINILWQTGLGGSIVSGIAYIISCIYIYKTTFLVTKKYFASWTAFFVFALNPNILYMQSTPMSELPLIVFFILSTYYFIKFIYFESHIEYLVLSALFGFLATLSRYDGWFLVLFEAICLIIFYLAKKKMWRKLEGLVLLFSTLSFFGVLLWFLWDYIILGDPLYFTNSPFSAKSQQQGWEAKGELPAQHHIITAVIYYAVTAVHNVGIILSITTIISLLVFFIDIKKFREKIIIFLLFFVPFIFYVVALYEGQAVIFIPDLTPKTYPWTLFNVRYGIMMVPFTAFFIGFLSSKTKYIIPVIVSVLVILQTASFTLGYENNITLEDGMHGLSASKQVDAQFWIKKHYTGGLVLLDDYARTISIVRSGIPINKVIYIGNKPYWQESLENPQKFASWIIIQKNDALWTSLYESATTRGKLYKYFTKVYTSPNILIFEKNSKLASNTLQ